MKKLKRIFCAVFRHSHLVTNCMGYKHCARCGEQLADSWGGTGLPVPPYYQIAQRCICEDCRAAFDRLTWLDRFLCPRATFPTASREASE